MSVLREDCCPGCSQALLGHPCVTAWMKGPLGLTARQTHRGCEDAAAKALGYRLVQEPPTKGAPSGPR
jgi:hypothetical protein